MDNEEGKSKQSIREMSVQGAVKEGNGAAEDGSCSSVTFVNRPALSGSVENDMHKKVIQGGKEISDELGDVLEVLIRYLGAQPKRKSIDCFLCTDKEKVLEHPKEIHTLFKLYSALVFCMLEHRACVKYSEKLVEDMFNLENYLLDQIAVKELEFMDAYRDEAMDHRREQLIAMGNVFKIDDALHINREEEIESLTYKFYRKVGDARFLSDAEINLICLILYKRKESFRFFRIFKERKLLINYRLAVLFSLRSECMYKPTEIISQNKSRKFEYEDIGTYKLKSLFIRGGVTNPENFFEHMKYKLGLDRVHEVDQEIEYEKELKTFEGIVVTKRADVNSREFKKWFNRENRKHQWMECVKMWVANRRMDKNVMDLSMIDMCCQYKEFENGHFIYEMLEPITNEKVLKDCFVKYCLLCIHALKEGNKKFNDTIVSNLDETFAKMICSGSSQGSGRSANRTIKSETMESYYDLKRCASKKGEQSLHVDDVSALSVKKGDTVEYGTAMGGLSDFKTEICIDVEEVNSALHQECGALSNRGDGSRGESVVDTSIASRSSTESTRSSLVIDVDFIRKWTDRLVLLIKKARRLDRESSVSWDINRSMTEMTINNILYFEKTCRKEVLEVLLCDICINDEMVQLLLKGFYCYCLSCKESSVKTISDCDMVYKFAEHIYKCWKKKKSGLSLFRRKDPHTKQTIYCCMLGVCCETEKVDQFMDVCKDLKGSSTELNGEMINILKKFHDYKKCNCDFFRNNPNRHYKKHLINHIFKKE